MKLISLAKQVYRKVFPSPAIKNKKLYYKYLDMPIRENVILYEAFGGLGILDNPRAIFKALLDDDRFDNYTHVWSIKDDSIMENNISEFSFMDNVIIVDRDSKDFYMYLATAKYIFNNSGFDYYFIRRPEQIYTNTWHGIPTKYMGYEHSAERVENSRGPVRNFLSANYLISANSFMTETMYQKAYMMHDIFEGEYIEQGHPRCDAVINTNSDYIMDKLSDEGIHPSRKIILYAPTWKGRLYNQLEYNIDEYKNIINFIRSNIDTDEYEVYLRVHYFIYKELKNDEELSKILIPFTIDTNEFLSIVDILISDYSSIFFDFLVTGRPVLFYVPDLNEYVNERGLYIPIEDLPGPVSDNLSIICNGINQIEQVKEYYKDKYDSMTEWCCPQDDGNASKHIINRIFNDTDNLSVWNQSDKEHILIFIDASQKIGKTLTRLKAQIDNTDYKHYDITILTPVFKDGFVKQFWNKFNPNVRIIIWKPLPYEVKLTSDFFDKEVTRCISYTHFDKVYFIGEKTEYFTGFFNAIKCKDKYFLPREYQ
ncbi:MAG: CDP-glycerol glycerophosphotransferase family protein [Eubacterium sp.]